MLQVTTIGLDIAKNVFHAHGADERGAMVFSRKLTRGKLLDFFVGQPACVVALEACGGAHHWARELQAMGHDVRLIPPAYVKPFVKRHKNDAIDAEAICEAAQRPGMRFVAVKRRSSRPRAWCSARAISWCDNAPSSSTRSAVISQSTAGWRLAGRHT